MVEAATPMPASPNLQNNSSSTMKSSTKLGLSLDAFVLMSLLFQFILLITAPGRKHLLMLVLPVVWLAYLLKLDVSNYAMGLIPDNTVQGGRTGDLRLFWAPFLILHLGGPNTITGLSLADNELWLRYAFRLVSLSYTFGRVFIRSFLKNDLWVPTAILFLAGALRYIEKVICRFQARLTKFRDSTLPKPDPGVNYPKLMQTYHSLLESNIPVVFRMSNPAAHDQSGLAIRPNDGGSKIKLTEVQIVKEAYRFFHDFRGLFVNSVYSYDLREDSRRFFLSRHAEDAFSICEVELNFAYDVFYTKSILIDKPVLRWLNFVSLLLQIVSTVLWILIDKTNFHPSSVQVTNALVYGSISLDLFSLFMLAASDWDIAWVNQTKAKCFFEMWLLLKKRARERQRRLLKMCFVFKFFRVFFRWSECVPQLDLISSCIRQKSMASFSRKSRDESQWIKIWWFTKKLRDFLFDELEIRSVEAKQPTNVEELCSSRGLWALGRLSRTNNCSELAGTLAPWVSGVDYEESLILWHIATTLCYYTSTDGEEDGDLRECSKALAGYMLHLLIRPAARMMPPSAKILGRVIFLDTCADAKRFLDRKLPRQSKANKEELLRQGCEKILQVNTDVIPPSRIKGDKSKSVLFDGSLLAKELQRLEDEKGINKWEIISKVWAEMLFYCAVRSRASAHLEKIVLGGELLTIVWLLMAHLGLGNHFRYNKDATAELVTSEHSA